MSENNMFNINSIDLKLLFLVVFIQNNFRKYKVCQNELTGVKI